MCGVEKSLDGYHTDSRNRDGLKGDCGECLNAMGRKYKAERRAEDPTWRSTCANAALAKVWGVGTREAVEQICGHTCYICGREESENKRLAIDHCHETGDIRGLLCSKCNKALGLLGDDIDTLKRAIEYLADPPADKLALRKLNFDA